MNPRITRGDKIRVNGHEFKVLDARDSEIFFRVDSYRQYSLPEELVEKVLPEPKVGDVWLDRSGRAYVVARDDVDDLVGIFTDEHGYSYSVTLVDERDFVERIYTREDS